MRTLGRNGSRRRFLSGLLGFGGLAAAGGVAPEVDAARRPETTPKADGRPNIGVCFGSFCANPC